MEALYTATATVKGGRTGSVASSDGVLRHDLKMPKELGGAGGEGTNPERLLRPDTVLVTKVLWLM